MHKLTKITWSVAVCFGAYPLGMLLGWIVLDQLQQPLTMHQPWFSFSFGLAQLGALLALPFGLWPTAAGRLRVAAVGVLAWTASGHGLWLTAHFFLGTIGTIERRLLFFTVFSQLALASLPLLLRFSLMRRALVPAIAVLACLPVLGRYYPDLRTTLTIGRESYVILGTFLLANCFTYALISRLFNLATAQSARHLAALTAWVAAAHVVWISMMFLIPLDDLPSRTLPLITAFVQWTILAVSSIAQLAASGRLALSFRLENPVLASDPAAQITLERSSSEGRRTAWIISYTGVSNEPRVVRQSQALVDDGWRVVVCGYDGHSARPAAWTYVRLPSVDPYHGRVRQVLAMLRLAGQMLAALGRPRALARLGAIMHHACVPNWMHIRRSVLALARANPDLKPDLVLCNDYFTCDVGYALASRYSAKLAVDCHEYAVEQNAHDAAWVKWTRPYIAHVQDYYLTRADIVSTVCDGIADLLNKDHALKRPVLVVRSVPTRRIQPFRPTGDRIKVLYHGGLWHVRQLHVAIESMRAWRPEFDLVLRGDGDPSYISELKRLAERYGLEKRVFFEPAVPFEQIIPAANCADIGYFSYANFSRQSQFVLPNKFFEYVMAGLALCVIDLTEMGRLARKHDLGKCIPEHKASAIAATINNFTREDIDRYKRQSLKAAEELNWDHEKMVMIAAFDQLFGERAAKQSTHSDLLKLSERVSAEAPARQRWQYEGREV